MTMIQVGDTLTCAVTGETFIAAQSGAWTFNYAIDSTGRPVSDAGVDIAERRELLDRRGPFVCYLSQDGRSVTGWKGNVLGTVTRSSVSLSGWHGASITAVRVTDVHGGAWHGRGAGRGMAIRLHPSKVPA
jgi:hypothetical protein